MNLVILDGEKIISKEQLHRHLAWSLNFPEWYGKNLDALYDCLTDVQERTGIHVLNKEALYENLGPMTHGLLRVLRDAAAENPNLHVEM